MAFIPLQKGIVTCYIVRHGERIDHIDETWAHHSPTPYDPPLTESGHNQALKTGQLIYDLEMEAATTNPHEIHQTEYTLISSPFLRCTQTARQIHQGFCEKSRRPTTWSFSIEPGISELMSERYFDRQVPDSIIDREISPTLKNNIEYTRAMHRMPVFPEAFQDMMARFVSTFDHVVTGALNGVSKEEMLCGKGRRKVLVLVTHGAGVNSLLWATEMMVGFGDPHYCCLTRAKINGRRSSLPLSRFGVSRVPMYSWSVDYKAYSKHIT